MGGSAAKAPTLPDGQPVQGPRASDADRDEVIAKLTDEFAAGRLSHHTFIVRMHAVLEARHQSDLPPLLADLPAGAGPESPAPADSGSAALAPGGTNPPGGSQSGLRGRLRAVLPRRPATTQWRAAPGPPGVAGASGALGFPAAPGVPSAPGVPGVAGASGAPTPSSRGGLARRLTSGMPRARSQERRPAPLRFPRGAGPRFSIGRDAGCDLAIADMTVSRVHAVLERTTDGWLLTDLDSTNGTRVNGWRVRGHVPVRAGDLVSFGRAEYCLSAADGCWVPACE